MGVESKMKKFIKNEKCSKCGGKDIALSHHKKEDGYGSQCWKENTGSKEHICHYCRICGFNWITKILN